MPKTRPVRGAGSNRQAMDQTIEAMKASKFLQTQDQALVQLVRSLADAVDRDPQNASLWREYRGAVSEILSRGRDDSDAYTDLITRLRTPVGHTTN